LASEHDVKGFIRIPVTIIEELMTQAGGDDAAPAGEGPEVADVDVAVQEGEDPEGAEVDGTAQDAETAEPEQPEQPEQREQPVPGAMTGTVARFIPDKGYGFITPDDGSEDIFIHLNQCNGAESLIVGDAVTYQRVE
jgi:CspA family cold shock protein